MTTADREHMLATMPVGPNAIGGADGALTTADEHEIFGV